MLDSHRAHFMRDKGAVEKRHDCATIETSCGNVRKSGRMHSALATPNDVPGSTPCHAHPPPVDTPNRSAGHHQRCMSDVRNCAIRQSLAARMLPATRS